MCVIQGKKAELLGESWLTAILHTTDGRKEVTAYFFLEGQETYDNRQSVVL
jgi:hypothetical protein